MYFDFNLPYPKKPSSNDLEGLTAILKRIQSIDQATIAWNITVDNLTQWHEGKTYQPELFETIQQLTRVTVTVDNPKKNLQLVGANPLNQKIDILAVQPMNIDACKHSCQTHEVDMISLDLAGQNALPGHVTAQLAISRGIFFEICYTQAIREPQQRSFFFANVTRLVQQTRGHNLILSSGAIRALEIKRPSDIKMLALMSGMNQAQAEAAVGYNYHRLLRKAETRKSTILAAIRINTPLSLSSEINATATQTVTPKAKAAASNQQKRKSKNKQQHQQKKAKAMQQ